MMAQNRDAPAYQEYAAATLAKLPFRLMTLEARGLLYTMRLECWVNRHLPSSPKELAVVLGASEDEVRRSLSSVMTFFHSDGEFIQCPELEDYREHLNDRKRRQSEGGKTGAERKKARVNLRKTGRKSASEGNPEGDLKVTHEVTPRSLVQQSKAQHSQNQLTGREVSSITDTDDEWFASYDQAESF